MKLIFVLCLTLIGFQLSKAAEKKECKITEAEAEACGSRMLILNENFTMPKDAAEIENRCKSIEEGMTCFKDYAKNCLDQFSSRIMGMVGRNGKKMMDKICSTQENRTELYNHLMCWETAENMAPINLCLDKYMVQAETLADIEGDHRIPATCCTFHQVKKCLVDSGSQKCNNPASVKYIENLATGVTGELIKFVCGNFKTMEDCDAKMDKEVWDKLKKLVESNDPAEIKAMKKFNSPFAALKTMLKKFKN